MKIHGMGWNPSPFDPKDFTLGDFIPQFPMSLSLIRSKYWDFPVDSLNQDDTPHCVGFSIADFGINLPTYTSYTNEDGHDFYYKCKIKEGHPGEENGSNLRAAAKVMKDAGRINAYAFANKVDSIKWWLLNKGPMIAGTVWTTDMYETNENFVIKPTGSRVGGHAYLLNGYTSDGYISIQNSWGNDWGLNGKAYIHEDDLAQLLRQGGEVITAVELPLGWSSKKSRHPRRCR